MRNAVLLALVTMSGCATAKPESVSGPATGGAEAALQGEALAVASVIELSKLRSDPGSFEWFQFKPGVKKLILSGTPDSRHISMLWYTSDDGKPGAVPLHYHAQTESIYVIDGAQSDPKGKYERGSFYFNPPGSAHNVFDSTGLFLLSYAAPPDFSKATPSPAYEPLVIADASKARGELAVAPDGGLRASFVRPTQPASLSANVLLVLDGPCTIEGQAIAADTLIVGKSTQPATYRVAPAAGCTLFQLAFTP